MPQVGVGQRDQPIVQEGGVIAHRAVGVQHRRQHFVVNVQRGQGLLRSARRCCGNGSDGVAAIEGFLAGHHVAAVKAVVDRSALFLVGYLRRDIGKVR